MGRRLLSFVIGLSLCATSICLADVSASLKANLDLPYDAFASAEEEEELAPEVVVFFGQQYESDAIVFALDESGSMNDAGRWQLQTREVVRAIVQLSERGEFGVLYYGSNVSTFRDKPIAASGSAKSAATSFIASRSPRGDTCLFEGLIKALEIVRKSGTKRRAVILTSDGRPDWCPTGDRATPQQIEMLIQRSVQANPGRSVRVHTIWVGSGSDQQAVGFMQRLATVHGGTFREVSR